MPFVNIGVDVVGKTEGQSTLQHNVSNLPIIRTFSRFFFSVYGGGWGEDGLLERNVQSFK